MKLFCKRLHFVDIPRNSELQIIKEYAFCKSNIVNIFIPNKVTQICESCFSYCKL